MKRLLTLMLMATMVLVNGTALAAAMCIHEDAAAHASALQADDAGDAAVALAEDAAGSAVAKRGTLADAGSLLLATFVLPASSDGWRTLGREALPSAHEDDPSLLSRTVAPLLEPPAA